MSPQDAKLTVRSLNLECHAHSFEAAEAASELAEHTSGKGLSPGDRSCLALARKLGLPAATADRIWLEVADMIGVSVVLVR